MKQSRLWLGRTQIIPFTLAEAAVDKVVLPTTVVPPDSADILLPATILKGEKTGFLRIRGLQAGKITLQVGDKSLPLSVLRDSADAVPASRPEIISPPEGACIYGTITAGVEVDVAEGGNRSVEPRLILPGGKELVPRAQTLDGTGSTRLYAFDINADELPPGPCKLQTYMTNEHKERLSGEPVAVNVIRPDPSAMISGPCVERVNDPRPQRIGEKLPQVVTNDPKVPEGYVKNQGANPAWCMKETIDKPGLYQFTMLVKGDASSGAYPSIGVELNEKNRPDAAGRLVDKGWHRVPIGRPIHLDAGDQYLTARFLNDFSGGKNAKRNLYLERYELLRVAEDHTNPTEGGDSMMMSGDSGGTMMMADAAMDSSGGGGLQVSFEQPLNGKIVQGPLRLRAKTWRPAKTEVPMVDILVNGTPFSSQQGSDLNFSVPVEALKKGANTLQLRARIAPSSMALSPMETVLVDDAFPGQGQIRRSFRYTVEDQSWDPGMSRRIGKDQPPAAAFFTNGEAILTLPSDLQGEFALQLEAKGQDFQGPPIVEAYLKTEGAESVKIGESPIKGYYSGIGIGKVTLAKGNKQIVLRYSNDLSKGKEGDRNWWLKSLQLEEPVKYAGEAPKLQLLYPRFTSAPFPVAGASAVVAKVFSREGIDWTDLTVDGISQNLRLRDDDGLGRVVLPVVTTTLKEGEHVLRVVVRGKNGKETTSEAIPLRVAASGGNGDDVYARAVYLLNRFGYGPEPEELADVLLMGPRNWLKDRLARSWNDAGEQAAFQRAWNEFPLVGDRGKVIPRVISYLLRSPNPARCRFVLWTENHFSTWIEKAQAENKWREHERFMELGAAPFGDLLMASATSPAMIVYLDQARSFANKLNENYAREIMELHTLGVHGGYKQVDVTNLASILTGWTLSADSPVKGPVQELAKSFSYEPGLNNSAEKTVFGMEFPKAEDRTTRYDRTLMALEMLTAHPSTATFITRKIAEHYVSMPAPESLVARLANRFRETSGDTTEVLLAIVDSPEFWAAMNQPKVTTPLDFSLRLARQAGFTNPYAVSDFLRKSGTGLFDRATPDGYSEIDSDYMSSNALLQRWRFTQALSSALQRLLPPPTNPPENPWSTASQERDVSLFSTRLLGFPLTGASREAAIQYLSKATVTDSREKTVTALVSQLPPASLR